MNREVHVRIWERLEVRVLRATRHEERFPLTKLSVGCGFRKETLPERAAMGETRRRPHARPRWSRGRRANGSIAPNSFAASECTHVMYVYSIRPAE